MEFTSDGRAVIGIAWRCSLLGENAKKTFCFLHEKSQTVEMKLSSIDKSVEVFHFLYQ